MFTVQYGEPSDFEDLAEVKPGVKGEGAVVAEPRGGDQALTGSRISIPGFFGTGFCQIPGFFGTGFSNIFDPGI